MMGDEVVDVLLGVDVFMHLGDCTHTPVMLHAMVVTHTQPSHM